MNIDSTMNQGVTRSEPGQWPKAAKFWPMIGEPLRPNTKDIEAVITAVSQWPGSAPRVLILGVTPEYYHLKWPEGSSLQAVDRTPEMIEYVWPGTAEQAALADWRELPFPDSSFDIVLCDGGLHLLDYPAGQKAMIAELHRTLAPGGLAVFRLFTPAAIQEHPDHVLDELEAGEIRDLNCLKLRLGHALQTDAESGVALAEVWQTLRNRCGDWPSLAARLNWPLAALEAIDAYHENPARYHFVSQDEARILFESGGFTPVSSTVSDYPMGNQCPTDVYQKVSGL